MDEGRGLLNVLIGMGVLTTGMVFGVSLWQFGWDGALLITGAMLGGSLLGAWPWQELMWHRWWKALPESGRQRNRPWLLQDVLFPIREAW